MVTLFWDMRADRHKQRDNTHPPVGAANMFRTTCELGGGACIRATMLQPYNSAMSCKATQKYDRPHADRRRSVMRPRMGCDVVGTRYDRWNVTLRDHDKRKRKAMHTSRYPFKEMIRYYTMMQWLRSWWKHNKHCHTFVPVGCCD